MEFLNQIWVWVAGILGGISYTGIIGAVIYGCLRGGFNRTIQKLNVEKINENIANKQMERIKKVSFTQNIQPIVESELKKITENANAYIDKAYEKVEIKFDKILNVMKCFAAYFDNSIAVTDEAKENLKNAIAEAEKETSKPVEIDVQEIVIEETPKVTEQPKVKVSKTKVER